MSRQHFCPGINGEIPYIHNSGRVREVSGFAKLMTRKRIDWLYSLWLRVYIGVWNGVVLLTRIHPAALAQEAVRGVIQNSRGSYYAHDISPGIMCATSRCIAPKSSALGLRSIQVNVLRKQGPNPLIRLPLWSHPIVLILRCVAPLCPGPVGFNNESTESHS
jgi:hypothetical protein